MYAGDKCTPGIYMYAGRCVECADHAIAARDMYVNMYAGDKLRREYTYAGTCADHAVPTQAQVRS
jgi:hypothetical protein